MTNLMNYSSKIIILCSIFISFLSCGNKTDNANDQVFDTNNEVGQSDNNEQVNQNTTAEPIETYQTPAKLDWFSAIIYNPNKDYANFTAAGYDKSNVKIHSKEEYKKNKIIREFFSDDNGNFDEGLFNITYDKALRTYEIFISGRYDGKSIHRNDSYRIVNAYYRKREIILSDGLNEALKKYDLTDNSNNSNNKKESSFKVCQLKVSEKYTNNSNVTLKITGIKYPNSDTWSDFNYIGNVGRSDREDFKWLVFSGDQDYYFNY